MKVCFVNALFYPFRGGTENHMLELGPALARQGVDVHVVTAQLKGGKKTELINGVKVHRIPCKFFKIKGLYPPPLVACPNFLRYLREIDARENFDLFHLHSRWFPDFTLVRRYCLGTGKPLVLTVHNARPIGINPVYTVFGSAYEAAIGKKVLRSADQLIAVSRWTRDDVLKYKLDKNKFTVIHNGLDFSQFSTKHSPDIKKKLRMGKNEALIIWVGRIVEQKGLRYLFQAMPEVLKNFSAKLLLVGTGSEEKQLRKQARALGIGKSIVFYGEVTNRKELNNLLRGADVFVFPSIWEPFGIACLEAMASGLPVVATKTGGIPEIVQHGKNGLLVPPRSAGALATGLVYLLKNKRKRLEMGRNARKTVEKNFAWRRIAAETKKVYAKALRGKGKKKLIYEVMEFHRQMADKLREKSKKHLKKYRRHLRELKYLKKRLNTSE